MEVFEHISDPVGFYEIQLQGVVQMLVECFRMLKPNGKMFVTTPNAISFLSLFKLLNGAHPSLDCLHYREYTPKEIETIFSSLFDVLHIGTFNVFHDTPLTFGKNYYEFIQKSFPQIDHTLRGDDIFMICEKKNIDIDICDMHLELIKKIAPNCSNNLLKEIEERYRNSLCKIS